jgi:hypothetical protein
VAARVEEKILNLSVESEHLQRAPHAHIAHLFTRLRGKFNDQHRGHGNDYSPPPEFPRDTERAKF